ncbi:hypothetical protein SGUI_0162 [Serinicoccus hydrothermalis]|uniref:Uncharacterized protein n=1 Tax=Serinicoccus hydrothermalis TaxID=1758689 RepID=A0A1B1N814_9MICO|nr:hypothetical protein [Serinicoccus hydrothermalis]ANS77558.1 hypothetical protein SGUI_0162 [Serinicoccus hydrothermalis]
MSEQQGSEQRPRTGDDTVDAALDRLDQALAQDDEGAPDALARAHRDLQQRLHDPSPAGPGTSDGSPAER